MNAGVGAPGAGYSRGSLEKRRNRLLQNRLNRLATGLDLPAVVAGPVIFDGDLDVHTRIVSGLGFRV